MKTVLLWVGLGVLLQVGCGYAMAWKNHRGSTLGLLEKDWLAGGNEAQQYDLNRFCSNGCCGSIFSQAIFENKSPSFIEYLIACGAQVQQNKTYTVTQYRNGCIMPTTFLSDSLSMASCHPNVATVRALIKHGGLKYLDAGDKNGLLIRFIRESKKEAINCLECLIDQGCPVDCDADGISEIAYVSIPQQQKKYDNTLTSPLIEAVRLKVPEVIKLLLEVGADPTKKYGGKSAWDFDQAKNFSQEIRSWFGKAKQQESLLRHTLEIINREKEIIKNEKAKVVAEDNKRQAQRTRLINCVTSGNTPFINISYLLSLQREYKEIIS